MTREEADDILIKAVVERYPTTYNGTDVIQVLLEVFNDKEALEAQLKAKDEEIEGLKDALEMMTAMCELGLKTQDAYRMIVQKMKAQNKARQIVAMLFWEWKKQCENCKQYNYHTFAREQKRSETYYCFKKSYAMLKDKQC